MNRVTAARTLLAGLVGVFLLSVTDTAAVAAVRGVTSASFYYEDNTTGSHSEIRVAVGDQLSVTVVGSGRHTVEIDELGISSGGRLSEGQTYTTPPLNTAGTFRMYCDPHEGRGHVTTLIVGSGSPPPPPAPSPTPSPTPTPTPTPVPTTTASSSPTPTTTTTASSSPTPTTTTTASSSPTPTTTTSSRPTAGSAPTSTSSPAATAPSISATSATDGAVVPVTDEQGVPEALEGTQVASGISGGNGTAPWTRGVRLGLLALLPMVVAAGWAVRSR